MVSSERSSGSSSQGFARAAQRGLFRAVLLSLALVAAACGGDDADDSDSSSNGKPETTDRGDIKVMWVTPPAEVEELALTLRQTKLLEDIAKALNASLKLPKDLPVVHKACGEENAFYDPEEGRIVLCYEMMLKVAQVAASDPSASEEEVGSHFVGAWLFIFFHELGHALIDIYDLPSTGKEEDAVDDFSSVLLIESDLSDLALEAASFWAALDAGEYSALDFADEHSLSPQRFYTLVCNVFGSDPDGYEGLISNEILPESRAVRCPAEYQMKLKSWGTLLEPWAK